MTNLIAILTCLMLAFLTAAVVFLIRAQRLLTVAMDRELSALEHLLTALSVMSNQVDQVHKVVLGGGRPAPLVRASGVHRAPHTPQVSVNGHEQRPPMPRAVQWFSHAAPDSSLPGEEHAANALFYEQLRREQQAAQHEGQDQGPWGSPE